MKNVLLLLVVAASWYSFQTYAATYYVDPDGTDSDGSGSMTQPFAHVSYACPRATAPGDVIEVNAGSYTDDGTCTLMPGVRIVGAGRDTTVISITAQTFISAEGTLPAASGDNEISGLTFRGSDYSPADMADNGTQTAIYFAQVRNQAIHDCHFENLARAMYVQGKPTRWEDCPAPPTYTPSLCENDKTLSVGPLDGEWATGIAVYNNTLKNAKMTFRAIRDSEIYGNSIDNTEVFRSAVGHTGLFWRHVDFHHNTIALKYSDWSVIAVEVWEVSEDSRFFANQTNSWFSINMNNTGPDSPYSYEIVGNRFASDVPDGPHHVSQAIEASAFVQNVLIADNYFTNTGANGTFIVGVGIAGWGQVGNFTVRNNVFFNLGRPGVTDLEGYGVYIASAGTGQQPFDGDGFYVYNNLFDQMETGVFLHTDSTVGDQDDVKIKNNIFENVDLAVVLWNTAVGVSGHEFSHNVVYNAERGVFGGVENVAEAIAEDTTYTWAPELLLSGDRPFPYYRPAGASANVIHAGVDVGLPFAGAAPDVGPYELFLCADGVTEYYVGPFGNDPAETCPPDEEEPVLEEDGESPGEDQPDDGISWEGDGGFPENDGAVLDEEDGTQVDGDDEESGGSGCACRITGGTSAPRGGGLLLAWAMMLGLLLCIRRHR